jgi:hypothetical protein
MQPIKTNEANYTYLGPTPEIADLPCRINGHDTFAAWEPTDEERALIAAGGHIRLGIYGMRPIPPVSLEIVANVGPYERVSAPCDQCNREPDDPIHGMGSNTHPTTHAYRSRSHTRTSWPPPGPAKFG